MRQELEWINFIAVYTKKFLPIPGMGVPEALPLHIPLPCFVLAVLFRVFSMYVSHTKSLQNAF